MALLGVTQAPGGTIHFTFQSLLSSKRSLLEHAHFLYRLKKIPVRVEVATTNCDDNDYNITQLVIQKILHFLLFVLQDK